MSQEQRVFRCSAYPWPHRLGGGKCDRASDTIPPLNATSTIITSIIAACNGVQLCEGSDGAYYVGLGYAPGDPVGTFDNPQRDFCSSEEFEIAERYFATYSKG